MEFRLAQTPSVSYDYTMHEQLNRKKVNIIVNLSNEEKKRAALVLENRMYVLLLLFFVVISVLLFSQSGVIYSLNAIHMQLLLH